MPKGIELYVSQEVDEKEQPYLYIHMKDYSSDEFFTACKVVRSAIKQNCPRLIDVMSLDDNSRKQLLWLPKDKNCFTLYEDDEEYKAVTPTASRKKNKP